VVGEGFALISRCSVSVSDVAHSAVLSRFQYPRNHSRRLWEARARIGLGASDWAALRSCEGGAGYPDVCRCIVSIELDRKEHSPCLPRVAGRPVD
jgi:hypothetical protein